jgi:hypothetical protein
MDGQCHMHDFIDGFPRFEGRKARGAAEHRADGIRGKTLLSFSFRIP